MVLCVKLFGYNGVLMGHAIADIVSAILALGLLILCNPMKN